MKAVLSRRANMDLMAQIDWLAERSPSAARKLAKAVADGLRLLSEFPYAGRDVGDGEREWPIRLGRHGLIAVYRIEPDRLVIGRLFHTSEDRPSKRSAGHTLP